MKMLKLFFSLALMLLGCAGHSQKNSDVIKIEFTSLTRGYSNTLVFTKDSLTQFVHERGVESNPRKEKIKSTDWELLTESLTNVNLSEVSDLKSPTMKRAYDGARHSTILITTTAGIVVSHTFDDEVAHEKLVPLMKVISKLNQ
jgi:hypothetical protein